MIRKHINLLSYMDFLASRPDILFVAYAKWRQGWVYQGEVLGEYGSYDDMLAGMRGCPVQWDYKTRQEMIVVVEALADL